MTTTLSIFFQAVTVSLVEIYKEYLASYGYIIRKECKIFNKFLRSLCLNFFILHGLWNIFKSVWEGLIKVSQIGVTMVTPKVLTI